MSAASSRHLTTLAHDGDGLLGGYHLGVTRCQAGGRLFDSGSTIYNFLGNTRPDGIEVADLLAALLGKHFSILPICMIRCNKKPARRADRYV
jgi:hypothetical protein